MGVVSWFLGLFSSKKSKGLVDDEGIFRQIYVELRTKIIPSVKIRELDYGINITYQLLEQAYRISNRGIREEITLAIVELQQALMNRNSNEDISGIINRIRQIIYRNERSIYQDLLNEIGLFRQLITTIGNKEIFRDATSFDLTGARIGRATELAEQIKDTFVRKRILDLIERLNINRLEVKYTNCQKIIDDIVAIINEEIKQIERLKIDN